MLSALVAATLLALLPHELADPARQRRLAGQRALHPVLDPALVARAEQRRERGQARARPVDEAERARVVVEEVGGGAAVGRHRGHDHHERPAPPAVRAIMISTSCREAPKTKAPAEAERREVDRRRGSSGWRGTARPDRCPRSSGKRSRPTPRRRPRNRPLGRHLDLEELACAEGQRARDQQRREHLDARVVVLDVRVVDAPRGLDLVLDLGQLGLQALEALGRAQLRVGLRQGVDRARARS